MNNLIQTTNELTTTNQTIGEIANQFASQASFTDYRTRKAANTVKRQDSDLALFTDYLCEVGDDCQGDFTQAAAWDCVTWGLVEGFVKWQLGKGYSVSSVNVRLSTIKTYARLALKAGTLSETEHKMIRTVSGYGLSEAMNVDENRIKAKIDTRFNKISIKKNGTMGKNGAKKAQHTSIDKAEADLLKSQPDTPQGRRDNLLMAILLDHGLRCGEVAILTTESIDLTEGTLTFFRPKVKANKDKSYATHQMTLATLKAAKAYLEADKPDGVLIMGSRKGGKLSAKMSDRAITKRVAVLGEALAIEKLSAHDCRHYAATNLAKTKSINELMDIFGWSSPTMAVRYVEAAKVSILE